MKKLIIVPIALLLTAGINCAAAAPIDSDDESSEYRKMIARDEKIISEEERLRSGIPDECLEQHVLERFYETLFPNLASLDRTSSGHIYAVQGDSVAAGWQSNPPLLHPLCDGGRFTGSPIGTSSEAGMEIVAQREHPACASFAKWWHASDNPSTFVAMVFERTGRRMENHYFWERLAVSTVTDALDREHGRFLARKNHQIHIPGPVPKSGGIS